MTSIEVDTSAALWDLYGNIAVVALEIALTGEPITAAQGKELGLVNRVAPAGTALKAALELAEQIASNAPISVRKSKAMIHRTATRADWEQEVWEPTLPRSASSSTARTQRRAPQHSPRSARRSGRVADPRLSHAVGWVRYPVGMPGLARRGRLNPFVHGTSSAAPIAD